MCFTTGNLMLAKNALNPGLIPIKDDPHLKTQQQIDYNTAHPKILPPVFDTVMSPKQGDPQGITLGVQQQPIVPVQGQTSQLGAVFGVQPSSVPAQQVGQPYKVIR